MQSEISTEAISTTIIKIAAAFLLPENRKKVKFQDIHIPHMLLQIKNNLEIKHLETNHILGYGVQLLNIPKGNVMNILHWLS